MFSEGAQAPGGADRPDIIRSNGRDAKKDVIANPIRAGDDAPVRPVPMDGQGLRFLERSAHGPNVVRSDGVDSKKKIVIKIGLGTMLQAAPFQCR